jgi:hypothetical protein
VTSGHVTVDSVELTGARLVVRWADSVYPAEAVAKGAAFELFAERPEPGLLPNPRPGARWPYRRFVPADEVRVVEGVPPVPRDPPLSAPLSRMLGWDAVHRLSQSPREADNPLLAAVRGSARISRGTRMVKILSPGQLAGCLRGWLPQGFCCREHDIAHLRTPDGLAVLHSDGGDALPGTNEVVFALRWRAVDPRDYEVPTVTEYAGLVAMPPRDRLGPPILGTGFAPSGQHLIPEFVTAHLADLPLPAFAELVAFTADGTEVVLYSYQPESRAWTRMAGPQWRHLIAHVPDQEYFPVPPAPTRLVGQRHGQEYEAVADPPGEFRVLARTRAARYPVETLARRTPYVRWRGATCTVIRDKDGWLRVRLVRPDPEVVARIGATCVERGIYETWAPAAQVSGRQEVEVDYPLS